MRPFNEVVSSLRMATQVLDTEGRVITTAENEQEAMDWISQYIYRKTATEAKRETKGWTLVNRPD